MRLENRFIFTIILLALSWAANSCAKQVKLDADDSERRLLEAFLKIDQNNTWEVKSDGIAIFMNYTGSGKVVSDTSNVFVNITASDIKGNNVIDNFVYMETSSVGMSTNNIALAKQLGEYLNIWYYGERLFPMREEMVLVSKGLTSGLRSTLKGKREGDSFKVLLPTWTSDYGVYSPSRTATYPIIYEIEIVKVIEDYEAHVLALLQQYSDDYYGGIGPIKETNEDSGEESTVEGIYVATIDAGTGELLKSGDRINFNYTATLLNGFIFETSIEDVAREHRIYNSSNTYGTILDYQITSSSNSDSVSDGSGNTISLPQGVNRALMQMKAGGSAYVFFSHYFGYAEASSGTKQFGWWQPLVYHIVIDPAED
jgi:FKBP-type peptidyl-prolyl cis-trans isomerases 1